MRVTIIPVENRVSVEGMSEAVDCFSYEDINAVQWYGDHGEIEYWNGLGAKKLRANTVIDDFTPFQHLIDLWEIEAKKKIEVDENAS